eukprot:6721205-Pyramimonas_sp.AAC.1
MVHDLFEVSCRRCTRAQPLRRTYERRHSGRMKVAGSMALQSVFRDIDALPSSTGVDLALL